MRKTSSSKVGVFASKEQSRINRLSLHAAVRAGANTLARFLDENANRRFFQVEPHEPIWTVLDRMNKLDEKGYSALHYALRILAQELRKQDWQQSRFAEDMVVLLVRHGASHDTGDYTPLMCAANYNLSSELVSKLYVCYGDVNKTESTKGRTALHYAAARGNLELVKLLIRNRAHCNLKSREIDSRGVSRLMTAEEIAIDRGYTAVVECFSAVRACEEGYREAIKAYSPNVSLYREWCNSERKSYAAELSRRLDGIWALRSDPNPSPVSNGHKKPSR